MIGQHNVFPDATQYSEGLQYWHRWVISIFSVPHTPGPVLWTCLCVSLLFSVASSVCVGVSNYSRCPIVDVLLLVVFRAAIMNAFSWKPVSTLMSRLSPPPSPNLVSFCDPPCQRGDGLEKWLMWAYAQSNNLGHQSESIFLSHDHIHVLQQVDCSVKLLAGCCETAGDSC